MLPRELLGVSRGGDEVLPAYLRDADLPWLRALLDAYRRFDGRPRRELVAHLREPLEIAGASAAKVLRARHVLDRSSRTRVAAPVPPREIRRAACLEAARAPAPRDEILARAGVELGVTVADIERYLFADIGDERVLDALPATLDEGELLLRVNLALVQGMVARAGAVHLRLRGNARAIVRHAHLVGLLCAVREDGDDETFSMILTGPLALFRRTLVYGRALAGLVPHLVWCGAWAFRADVELAPGRRSWVLVQSGAPIFPAEPPRRFDSKLEQRFAEDFARRAPDWDVLREPRPLTAGDALVFPDFELVHRRARERRWLVEIVGFWTQEYLVRKLAQLRAVAGPGFIVCIDEERGCDAASLPEHVRVVPYRRRIDVGRVLSIIEEEATSPRSARP